MAEASALGKDDKPKLRKGQRVERITMELREGKRRGGGGKKDKKIFSLDWTAGQGPRGHCACACDHAQSSCAHRCSHADGSDEREEKALEGEIEGEKGGEEDIVSMKSDVYLEEVPSIHGKKF